MTPFTYEEIHGDEHNFKEYKEHEEIQGYEYPHASCLQELNPDVVGFVIVFRVYCNNDEWEQ